MLVQTQCVVLFKDESMTSLFASALQQTNGTNLEHDGGRACGEQLLACIFALEMNNSRLHENWGQLHAYHSCTLEMHGKQNA